VLPGEAAVKRVCASLLVLFVCGVSAGIPLSEAAVKVTSGSCSGGRALEGTGLRFRHLGKTFVVTSQAVALHGQAGFCHDIQGHTAELRAADWGRGLALFEVTGWAPEAGLSETSDWKAVAIAGEPVGIVGYELGEKQPTVLSAASVLLVGGNRHSIPMIASTVEVKGALLEAGLVGAPVEGAGGRILGLVSQQYLKMTPGTSTRAEEWDQKPGHQEDHVLVLPIDEVRAWVEGSLQKPFVAPFVVDAQDQLSGVSRIAGGSLGMKLLCPLPSSGGGGGGPIGGGEGVGVGGSQASAPFCSAELSVVAPPKGNWPFVATKTVVKELVSELGQGKRLELRYFLTRVSGGLLARVPVWSLSDVVTHLRETKRIAIIERHYGPGETPADKTHFQIRPEAERCLDLAREFFPFLDLPDVKLFAREAYLIGEVLHSEEWRQVGRADIDGILDLQGRHKKAWGILLQYHKQKADELRAVLGRVRALLPS
jgi:hypothetical protein